MSVRQPLPQRPVFPSSMRRAHLLLFLLLLAAVGADAFTAGTPCRIANGNMSLFVSDASLSDPARVLLWPETAVAAQRWRVSMTDSVAVFSNAYTGAFLTVKGGKRPGASVIQSNIPTALRDWFLKAVPGEADRYLVYTYCKDYGNLYLAAADGVEPMLVSEADTASSSVCWTIADAPVPLAFDASVRDAMLQGFLTQYYHEAPGGHILGKGGWWEDAEMFETILDAYETTGDETYRTCFNELCNNFVRRNGTDWSYNRYNDDITWMVLATIRAYRFWGTDDYRRYAKENFDRMYRRAKVYPHGMLRWCEGVESTNSCINGPAIIAATYLYEISEDATYLSEAVATYEGQRSRLLDTATGRVYDCGKWTDGVFSVTNSWCSTYNQGTMLGAAIRLYQITGERQYLDDAEKIWAYSHDHLTNGDRLVHVCQVVDGDLCGFKGIFMRYARHYAEGLDHPEVFDWIRLNAFHAYQNRNAAGVSWSKWLTKTAEDLCDGNKDVTDNAFGASTAVSAAVNAFPCVAGKRQNP